MPESTKRNKVISHALLHGEYVRTFLSIRIIVAIGVSDHFRFFSGKVGKWEWLIRNSFGREHPPVVLWLGKWISQKAHVKLLLAQIIIYAPAHKLCNHHRRNGTWLDLYTITSPSIRELCTYFAFVRRLRKLYTVFPRGTLSLISPAIYVVINLLNLP